MNSLKLSKVAGSDSLYTCSQVGVDPGALVGVGLGSVQIKHVMGREP